MNNESLKRYNKTKKIKLISAIIIDLVGLSSYFIPVVGESLDWVWGPISGVLIFMLFRNRTKMAIFGAVEEAIPFTDFIPTAFIAWNITYGKDNKKTLSEFLKKEGDEEQVVAEWTGK